MKTKEIREKSESELRLELENGSKELFELRNELGMSRKVGKPHRIRELRKTRARVLTILQEKRRQS